MCDNKTKKHLSRRKLLNSAIQMSAFAPLYSVFPGLMSQKLFAQQQALAGRKKLVWINMAGGWDILEATEPKNRSTSGIDMIYDWQDARQITGSSDKIGRWLPNLAALGQDLLVVRGIAMGTTSHEAGSTYMNTGILSNTGIVNAASIPAIIASESAATIPIIQLNGGSEILTDRGLLSPVSVVRASNLDLYQRMYPTDAQELSNKINILNLLRSSISQYQEKVGANDRLEELATAEQKVRDQFNAEVGKNLVLEDADINVFGTLPANVNNNMLNSFALTYKLIKNNLVTAVNLGIGGFDTHSGQSARLQPILANVDFYIAALARALRTDNLLADTLIVLYSDFGRTPKINNSNGRDHWPVGGAMIIGGNLAGGKVVGGTDDDLRALGINPSTGALQEDGTQISPVHIGGSVLKLILGEAYLEYRPYLESLPILTQLRSS